MTTIEWDVSYTLKLTDLGMKGQTRFAVIEALHAAMSQKRGQEIVVQVYIELIDRALANLANDEVIFRIPGSATPTEKTEQEQLCEQLLCLRAGIADVPPQPIAGAALLSYEFKSNLAVTAQDCGRYAVERHTAGTVAPMGRATPQPPQAKATVAGQVPIWAGSGHPRRRITDNILGC